MQSFIFPDKNNNRYTDIITQHEGKVKGGLPVAEKIYTIPINEAFDHYDGCPLCRLRSELDAQSTEYIMGSAMMEPDIRVETNRLGFCRKHFDAMLGMKNRLSLALMLESHIDELTPSLSASPSGGRLFGKKPKADASSAARKQATSCYVCERVKDFEAKYVSNIVYLWRTDKQFRQKFDLQPFFCFKHFGALLECAKREFADTTYRSFYSAIQRIEINALGKIRTSLQGFTTSYDHQNSGRSLTESERFSVERAIDLLAGKNRNK